MSTIDDSRAQIQAVVRSNEPLLWTGRPDPAVRFTRADAYLIPFSVFWCGFAVFWEYIALTGNGPRFMAFFGLPFVAIGLWMLLGRFFYKARRARRTSYGLTSQQAIIVVGSSVTEISVRTAPMTTSRTRDGRHVTVQLVAPGSGRGGSSMAWAGNTGAEFLGRGSYVDAFHDVADVDGVLRALDIADGRR